MDEETDRTAAMSGQALFAELAGLREELIALRGSWDRERELLQQKVTRLQLRSHLSPAEDPASTLPPAGTHFTIELLGLAGLDPATLTRPDLYLTRDRLDELYAASSNRIGCIAPEKSSQFVLGVAKRFAGRLARTLSSRLSIPEDLLFSAWFYIVWGELAYFIAARHLARRIARSAAGQTVLIPLAQTSFEYFGSWFVANDLEPFVIAHMLRRHGVRAVFACSSELEQRLASADRADLTFNPYPRFWTRAKVGEPIEDESSDRAVVVGALIRGLPYVLGQCRNPLQVSTPFDMQTLPRPDTSILDPNALPPAVTAHLKRVPQTPDGLSSPVFRGSLALGKVEDLMATLLGRCTQVAMMRAFEVVFRYRIRTVHLCDHPNFDSAILAFAVRQSGGGVVMWPHAANAVFPDMRRPMVDEIYCATRSAEARWRRRFPDTPVEVISDLVLRQDMKPGRLDPGEPPSLVIVDNFLTMGRVPLVDRQRVEQLYRRLFARLAALGGRVNFLCRTRWPEHQHYLWKLSGFLPNVGLPVPPPSEIDLPNMVFLFPVHLSSALLEGLGRGIPSLVLREGLIDHEYLDDDAPDGVPIRDLDGIIEEIMRCCDSGYRETLLQKQLPWYAREVNFRIPAGE